ncbi:MAG: hypothetical protein AB8G18_05825 [Gammaproteobacteria bacterium]
MPKLLEVSVSTEQILKDMGWFANLGFEERQANEILKHHYGVLGDSTFHVGLHQSEFKSPTLTYVLQNVGRFAPTLGNFIEFEDAELGELQFNRVSFFDPGQQRVNLIEARTFSPAFVDVPGSPGVLGTFERFELPHTPEREAFWQLVQQILRPTETDPTIDPIMYFNPQIERPTAVYTGNLDALVVHSAKNGWQTFSVNADDQGVLRTPFDFDILVNRARF